MDDKTKTLIECYHGFLEASIYNFYEDEPNSSPLPVYGVNYSNDDWSTLNKEAKLRHLLYMTQTLSNEENKNWDVIKQHRWIGFIQGILTELGYLTINNHKQIIRDMS